MVRIRRSGDRGHVDHGWLDTYHTFSFSTYHDPEHMGFRTLRVINEDVVQGGGGFPLHPHRDMEIITYILDGALEHRDSMGNRSVIRAGEVQRMSAGTGIMHSEQNASADEPVHLLQIWIHPERHGLEPGYEQREFPAAAKRGGLRLVASPGGEDGSLRIHQDARLWAGVLEPGESARHELGPERHGWLQVVRGSVRVGGDLLRAGDGAAVSDEPEVALTAEEPAEVLLFDLG